MPRVFCLGGWSPQLPAGFLVPRGTQVHGRKPTPFAYRTVTICGRPFQRRSARVWFLTSWRGGSPSRPDLQHPRGIGPPSVKPPGFRLIPVRSPLLGESRLISLLRGTKMFQFPHLPPWAYCDSAHSNTVFPCWVAPFGYPRLCLLDSSPGLIAVLPRPSSALGTKASTARPYSLDLR